MKPQIVSFHCVLRNKLGKVISSTYNRDIITSNPETLDQRTLAPLSGLVEGLRDLKEGQKRRIAISADKAFGFYDPELVTVLKRKSIPQGTELKIGDSLQIQIDRSKFRWYVVIEADFDTITIDANHPLAGQDLVFDIEATEVRDATPEEIAQSFPSKEEKLLH